MGKSASGEDAPKHLAYLDGWRGIAIASVIAGHFWLDKFISGVSTLGVDLFFVLSGRLMAEILFVRQTPLPTFFVRRLSRIYPGLLFFVLVSTLVFSATAYRHGPAATLSALTFTLNYAMIYFHQVAMLDHLWSLCVEEHGYVLLAGVRLCFGRLTKWAVLAIVLVGMGGLMNGLFQSWVLGKGHFAVFWRTDVQVAPMFLGAGLYLIAKNAVSMQYYWIAPLAFLTGIGMKLWGPNVFFTFGIGTILLALSVATMDFTLERVKRMFEIYILQALGMFSYSLYLWQQPFYKLSQDRVEPFPLLLAGVAFASLLSFFFIEKPARAFINDLWLSSKEKRKSGAAFS